MSKFELSKLIIPCLNHIYQSRFELLFMLNISSRYSHGRTCTLLNSAQKLIEAQGRLLLRFFICLHKQLSSFNSIIVQMSEKRDSSIDSQNEWLLLSVTLMAKVELVFVLRFRNAFSQSFYYKANRKSVGSSNKRYQGFSKQPSI